MLSEALAYLAAADDGLFVDATLGLGGHAEAILRASPRNRVIGLDRDGEALELARERLAEFGARCEAIHRDYRQIKQTLLEKGLAPATGILADLGVSSFQLETPERGFSFRSASRASGEAPPLDMRMDRTERLTAADLVNGLSERELADLIWRYGEEPAARRIARRIVAARARAPLTTTTELAELVAKAAHQPGRWRLHPATRTFQALRIAVNRELDGLEEFVADAIDVLARNGRLVVITFHSLEDRLIKRAVKFQAGHCVCPPGRLECRCGATPRVEILTRKAVRPSADEIASNPRARSAKLRACRKL
jgi:16S rRNA (cytosine1402-N4)-methyltransferase